MDLLGCMVNVCVCGFFFPFIFHGYIIRYKDGRVRLGCGWICLGKNLFSIKNY
jgi:hypothetical protein